MESYAYLTQRFAWPINMAKKHNYLIVDDATGRTHYLDRYADAPVTLCGVTVETSEIEWDGMAYDMGIECTECFAELHRRVLA